MSYLYLSNEQVEKKEHATRLVVLVHAYGSRPSHLRFLKEAVHEQLPDADLMVPGYPASKFANTPLSHVAEELVHAIDRAVEDRGRDGYREIILVGHSLGALIIRRAYCYARGVRMDHRPESLPAERSWIDCVSRMILISAMNRGWRLDRKPDYMTKFDYYWNRLLAAFIPLFGKGKMILSVLQGDPFIVNMRLQWMRLDQAAPDRMPHVVQMDGTKDDMIRSVDHEDFESGRRFKLLKVHGAGHLDVVRFDESLIGTWSHKLLTRSWRFLRWLATCGRYKPTPVFGLRRVTFARALAEPFEELDSEYKSTSRPDMSVKWVVFTVHGIRDFGHWTNNVRLAIERVSSRRQVQIECARPRYNWFPMVDFLIGFRRQRNVRWFMNEYASLVARYPCARISFIGHSNGTYLMSAAIWRYIACEFENVVVVGSVIPRTFPWSRFLPSRARSVTNVIGTRDMVVAIFPKLFEQFAIWFQRADRLKTDPLGTGWPGIGSGGFNGFNDLPNGVEEQFVRGGHGAGIKPTYHEALAELAVRENGDRPPDLTNQERLEQCGFVRVLSLWAPAVWLALLAVVGTLVWHSPRVYECLIGGDPIEWLVRAGAAVTVYFILKIA